MYRAILVDDEETVLRGLKNHVNWWGHGVEVVGAFPDCREAFAYLRANPVDLVVTDVITPYMNGIELAQKARELYPKIKIIFISGHADVNFLKDALKLEAVDYILKSIDLDELDQTLTRVVGMIGEAESQARRMQEMEEKLRRSIPLLVNNRLTTLLRTSDENEQTVLSEFQFLGIPMDSHTHYAVMVVWLNNKWSTIGGKSEKERLILALDIQSVCETVLAQYGSSVCFKVRVSEYVLIVNAEMEDCEETLLAVAEDLRRRMRQELGLEISIGISTRMSGLLRIREGYENACEAIERRYLIDSSLPISVNKFEDGGAGLKEMRERAEKEVCDAILSGDIGLVRRARVRSFEAMRRLPALDEQQNFALFLLMVPVRLLTHLDNKDKGIYASQQRLLERYLLCDGPEAREALIQQAYEEVTARLASMSAPESNALVARVCELIGSRYMQRLTVSSLAGEVYLTPTYLCVLFKQHTGKTINEYITLERIHRAKALLRDPGILLYDVCYMVGYLSPSYFSRLFKKHTGMTPSEYRDSVAGGRGNP